MGACCRATSALLAKRVNTTATQNTGSASSGDSARAAVDQRRTKVTKLPVTCAANRPLSARKPAVST